MRKRNVLVDERAVSPVIATILMVAITVVLAATLYMMLPDDNGPVNPVAGNLSYSTTHSNDTTAVFSLTLSTPSEPSLDTVTVRIFDNEDTRDGEVDPSDIIVHRVSDDDYIATGDRIQLRASDFDPQPDSFEGWEVIITFSGYSGEISDTV